MLSAESGLDGEIERDLSANDCIPYRMRSGFDALKAKLTLQIDYGSVPSLPTSHNIPLSPVYRDLHLNHYSCGKYRTIGINRLDYRILLEKGVSKPTHNRIAVLSNSF